jgi:hypothetical protein
VSLVIPTEAKRIGGICIFAIPARREAQDDTLSSLGRNNPSRLRGFPIYVDRRFTMATKKGSGRKYSEGASKQVETEMRAMKEGKLRSGNSKKKVTNPKQAIAIGLSEARRAGKKVPPPPKKAVTKKTATKMPAGKKSSKS